MPRRTHTDKLHFVGTGHATASNWAAQLRRTVDIPQLLVDQVTAARVLSLSVKTLQRRSQDLTIPSIRIGGRVLYSVETLTAWIKQQERAKPA